MDSLAWYAVQHCNSLYWLMVIHFFGTKIENGLLKGNKASPKEKIFQRLYEIETYFQGSCLVLGS